MKRRYSILVGPILAASALAARLALAAAPTVADYLVVPGSEQNSIRLTVESPASSTVGASLVSRPSWASIAGFECVPVTGGAEVRVRFGVDPLARSGDRGAIVLSVTGQDAQGAAARVLRRLPLTIAGAAPQVQRSFQIEECCIPAADAGDPLPRRFALLGAAPNPWRGSTAFRFGLPAAAAAALRVVDLAGRAVFELRTPELSAGYHEISWDGRDGNGERLAPGLYFYSLSAGPWRATGKTLHLR